MSGSCWRSESGYRCSSRHFGVFRGVGTARISKLNEVRGRGLVPHRKCLWVGSGVLAGDFVRRLHLTPPRRDRTGVHDRIRIVNEDTREFA